MNDSTLTPEQDRLLDEFGEICERHGLPMDIGYMEMLSAMIDIPSEALPQLEAWHERYMAAFPGSA